MMNTDRTYDIGPFTDDELLALQDAIEDRLDRLPSLIAECYSAEAMSDMAASEADLRAVLLRIEMIGL